ncbi:MAG: cyclic nucleotide-binding domain-containing protein [Vicinamibacteria bacterium]
MVLDLFGKSGKPGPKGRPAGRGGPPAGAQARELIAKKSYSKAIELLRVELTRRRGDERLRIQLADVLALAGRKDEAVEMLNLLSDDLALGGQAAKAIAALKRIQQIEPGRADVEEKLSYLILHQSRPSFDPWTKAKKEIEPVAIIDGRGEGPAGPGFGMEEIADEPPAEPSLAELFGADDAKEALVGMLEDVFTPVAEPAGSAPGESKLVDTPLFRDFSQEELVAVIRGLRLHAYAPGEIICSAGEPGDSLFILTSGGVRAYMRDKRGKHVQVREMSEGEFFGEMAVLTGNPRSATITAASDCELLELDRLTLNQISATHPNVRQVLQDFYKKRASHSIEAAIGQAPA